RVRAATAVAADDCPTSGFSTASNCKRDAPGGNMSFTLAAGGFLSGGWKTNSPRQLGQAIVCPTNAADVAIGRLQYGQLTAIRIACFPVATAPKDFSAAECR